MTFFWAGRAGTVRRSIFTRPGIEKTPIPFAFNALAISSVSDSITATTSFFARPVVSEIARMISVFVNGLLPVFFAISFMPPNSRAVKCAAFTPTAFRSPTPKGRMRR